MLTKQHSTKLIITFLIGIFIYFLPVPEGLTEQAWRLFAIFIATIASVMIGAFPMGAASLMGISFAVLTKCMDFETAFSGFTNSITWLILSAFFISYGFSHTGLGRRIALYFIAAFGKSSLGIAYGIGLTELILAPGTPSSTARTGGIIFPIVESIARSFESYPEDASRKRIGSYLILCLFNFTVVCSAMFMTAMAANPFLVKLAKNVGVEITWLSWALYASVPGLTSLVLIPIVLYKIAGPSIKDTAHAAAHAKEELHAIGPMKAKESLMALCFVLLMVLWLLGPFIGISAVIAALLGMSFLLIFGVATWDQLLRLHSAFETFIWFGALLALAEGLSLTGFTGWFGQLVATQLSSFPTILGILLLFLVYFYTHYLFASCTAHVGAMFLPFLAGAIALGASPIVFALALCYASSLFGGLTHYGIGPAPILFGSGYVKLNEWWKIGFVMSLFNIIIWGVVGGLWWKFLGVF